MTMYYFALLLHPERTTPPSPDQQAAELAEWGRFHERAASAIRAGDALAPATDAVRITGGPDAPVVTEGPYAEGAEVAGGYYVFEADDLDAALAIAQDIPAARFGAVEVWPMVEWRTPARATFHRSAPGRVSWKRTREYRLLQWLEREVPRRSQRVLPRASLRYEQLCGAPTVTSPPA